MDTLIKYYRKVELFFGNVKFAVVIIILFAIALACGTFMESYHGTEYANRLIYKSLPFMFIQFLMFLSIIFATLIRLPPKKHLYGFYVIHAGLIILFLGSFITYQSGIDGTMTLLPNTPNREIQINQEELKIEFPSSGKEVTVELPFVAWEKNLKMEYEGIKLGAFLPFAEDQLTWVSIKNKLSGQSSARYRLYNENFGEFITLSLHPDSDFNNTTQLGLLNVHYMPEGLENCFGANTPDALIVWSGENSKCLAPLPAVIKKSQMNGKIISQIQFDGKVLNFVPEMSPLPLDHKFQLDESSPYRVFSKKLFEKTPHLFLFGKGAAYFDKNSQKWSAYKIELNNEIELPWMGFKIRLLEFRDDAYASMNPHYTKPVQDNGQTIKGDLKAVQIHIGEETFWVKSNQPVAYRRGEDRVVFKLSKKAIILPYEIILDRFKMDTDPGTNTPASFESFVTLFRGNSGSTKHHVFMNNPMKYEDFTFYQASYFQTQQGPFGSVLSVNYDPGRPWKYLGSLLLVLGSIWHYYLRRKHYAHPGVARA